MKILLRVLSIKVKVFEMQQINDAQRENVRLVPVPTWSTSEFAFVTRWKSWLVCLSFVYGLCTVFLFLLYISWLFYDWGSSWTSSILCCITKYIDRRRKGVLDLTGVQNNLDLCCSCLTQELFVTLEIKYRQWFFLNVLIIFTPIRLKPPNSFPTDRSNAVPSQQAHNVETTSIQRNVESKLFQRCVPAGLVAVLCASVVSYVAFSIIIPHLSFFWGLGRAVLYDYDLFHLLCFSISFQQD